jgi:eukaryotic-like serine/threonine-protein kinase
VSENGVLAYQRREQATPAPLAWSDRSGRMARALDDLNGISQFSLAPDMRTIAVSRLGDIWLSDLDRGVTSRFTFDPADDTSPTWSPDRSRIVFLSSRSGRKGVYQKTAGGDQKEELLFTAPNVESIESWSPDGRFISYTSRDEQGRLGLWVLPLAGDRKAFAIQSPFNVRQGRFSPDGRWLAYVSDESGNNEVYVQAFPGPDGKWQVSANGGTNPQWRRDGRELFFVSAEKRLMAVAVGNHGATLELSVPRVLFEMRRSAYDVGPDGRFLIFQPEESKPAVPIDVVINWASEMER